MNLQRRTIVYTLAAAGALALGLAPLTAQASGSSDPISLWARAETGSFLTPLVEAYNKSHERQINLTLVPDAQVTQKYSAAAATGSGPDIAVIEIGRLPQFLASGWLQDITSDLAGLSYKGALSPAHLSQGALDGKNYALPFSADVSVLYWNKALFKAAGLDPDKGPKTWDEVRSTAAAVTKTGNGNFGYFFSGGCGGCVAFTMLPYPWAQGAEVMVDEKANFAGNTALKDSLQLYRDIVKDGSTPNTAQTENGANQFGPFFSGKIGMFVNGTYPYVELKKSHPEIEFGIELVPSKDGSAAASFAGGDDIAITKRIDKATGMEVLKWFTSEGQQLLAKSGVLPIRSDVAQADYVPLDPRNQVFVDALKYGHIPKSPKVNAVFFDNSSPFAGLVQAGIFGSGSIDAALSTAQAGADKVASE